MPFGKAAYLADVGGRRREDGVRPFLASRGIRLPEGSGSDPEEADLEPVPGAAALLRMLRRLGIRTAGVSSSQVCSGSSLAAPRHSSLASCLNPIAAWMEKVVAARAGSASPPSRAFPAHRCGRGEGRIFRWRPRGLLSRDPLGEVLVVALARKLLIASWQFAAQGLVPQGRASGRPG